MQVIDGGYIKLLKAVVCSSCMKLRRQGSEKRSKQRSEDGNGIYKQKGSTSGIYLAVTRVSHGRDSLGAVTGQLGQIREGVAQLLSSICSNFFLNIALYIALVTLLIKGLHFLLLKIITLRFKL